MTKFHHLLTILAASAAVCANSFDASAWGQKGHDITCDIARHHLTPKARKEIDKLLDGKSIVYWANWLDNASHTKEYAYTKTWHYKNVDADETYENAKLEENGDVVTAINAQVEALKSGTLNKEAAALSLKMLVHLVGDLHCPMHMAHRSDRGGNKVQVSFFGNGRNLHSVWDSGMIDRAHNWTFSEWADELDIKDKKAIAAITAGTVDDWAKETFSNTAAIYESTPAGSKIYYDEVAAATPLLEQQLLRGGLRLAHLLNTIFR